jgi:serine/threonine protein kinase
MPDDSRSILSLDVQRRIDELCDRFETEWRSGRTLIETYLGSWQGPARSALLGELLRVELEHRHLLAVSPTEEEYRRRFPDEDALLADLFGCTEPAGDRPPSIPGYELLGILGKGGMGVVYKARQVGLDRLVALKMILIGGHADAAQRQRFQSEAEVIARLQHPNIVQIHEVGEQAGLAFFAMEFCSGGSLADQLTGTPLEPRAAAALVEQLARATQAAHDKSIIHRDLKPANVLLADDGTPRITDFGLARRLDAATQTASGAIMGTPSYMAPEQASGHKVGPAADVYALGAILYECLAGRPPFQAATPFDTAMQVINEEPAEVRQLNATVPPDLETICHKCLRKEPAQRYSSAAELAADLRRFLQQEPIRARPVSRLERGRKWVRRNPVVAALVAAVAFLLIAGTVTSSLLAIRAGRLAHQAQTALQAREKAEQREREVARRFIAFIKKNPRLVKLSPEEMLARFQQDNPEFTPEEVEAGASAIASAAPSMYGD